MSCLVVNLIFLFWQTLICKARCHWRLKVKASYDYYSGSPFVCLIEQDKITKFRFRDSNLGPSDHSPGSNRTPAVKEGLNVLFWLNVETRNIEFFDCSRLVFSGLSIDL